MIDKTTNEQKVLVVLSPNFGERLRQVYGRMPIWVVMSPANEPVIRSIWASNPATNEHLGITALTDRENEDPEGRFLDNLETIDLHHGPFSTATPYTVINVIGVPLTTRIKVALSAFGFVDFSQNPEGFEARRSPEEATRIRN